MPDVEFSRERLLRGLKYLRDPKVIIAAVMFILIVIAMAQNPQNPTSPPPVQTPVPAAEVGERLLYTFNIDGIINETAPMSDSNSPYWWLDSGGKLIITNGVGETIQGDLPKNDPWYKEYLDTNAEDTENGLHPQNLLRLVSRSEWENVRVEASYYIVKDNISVSANRNESNGLLLMSRYTDDGQTLYYAGIRVDGTAVIKKKYKGTYYTMDQKQIFPGTYDHDRNPNLLPHSVWIRLKSETITQKDGSVTIRLYMEDKVPDNWKLLLSVRDHSQYEKTPPIKGELPVGLRTDFMDIKFDDILIEKL